MHQAGTAESWVDIAHTHPVAQIPRTGKQPLFSSSVTHAAGPIITSPHTLPDEPCSKLKMWEKASPPRLPYLIVISLLNKKCFSIISQFHVQIHCFPIDFYVNLKEKHMFFITTGNLTGNDQVSTYTSVTRIPQISHNSKPPLVTPVKKRSLLPHHHHHPGSMQACDCPSE